MQHLLSHCWAELEKLHRHVPEQRLGEVGRIDKFNVTGVFLNESVVIGISHKYKLQGDLHFILFILLQS